MQHIKRFSHARCHVPHGIKGQLSYLVWQNLKHFYFSFILLAEPLTDVCMRTSCLFALVKDGELMSRPYQRNLSLPVCSSKLNKHSTFTAYQHGSERHAKNFNTNHPSQYISKWKRSANALMIHVCNTYKTFLQSSPLHYNQSSGAFGLLPAASPQKNV